MTTPVTRVRPASPASLLGGGIRIAPDGWTNGWLAELGRPVPAAIRGLKSYTPLAVDRSLRDSITRRVLRDGLANYLPCSLVGYRAYAADPGGAAVLQYQHARQSKPREVLLNARAFAWLQARHPGHIWYATASSQAVVGSPGAAVSDWDVVIMPIAGIRG